MLYVRLKTLFATFGVAVLSTQERDSLLNFPSFRPDMSAMPSRPSSVRVGASLGDRVGDLEDGVDVGSVSLGASMTSDPPAPTAMAAQAFQDVGPLGTMPFRAEPPQLPPAAPAVGRAPVTNAAEASDANHGREPPGSSKQP